MKRLTLLFLLVCVTSGFTQQVLGKENRDLHFDIALAPAWLPLDGGEINIFSAQPMFGVTKTFNYGIDFSPGLYVFGDAFAKNGDDKNWSLGVALYLKIFKGGGVGLGYRVLQEKVGIQSPKTSNLALLFGIDLN